MTNSFFMPSQSNANTKNLKLLIWLYFALLIFEGALRKWIVPQLSAPLLIIRDPVIIAAYFFAIRQGLFNKNIFIKIIICIAFISFLGGLFTVITADSNLFAAIYGIRTNFLHLPLIFLMAKFLNKNDSIKLGKWILILALPMAVLMVLQFNAPPDAFINRTAGVGEGQQMSSALGRIRTPGTFSFITGVAQYFSLVAAFLFYGLFQKRVYSNLLLTTAGFGLVIALAVSGSRMAVVSVGIVVLSLLASILIKPNLAAKSYKFILLIGVISIGLNFIPTFSEGIEVLSSRVETANAHEAQGGGMITRLFSIFLEPFENIDHIPLLGYGLGMGSNAGAFLSTGKIQFLLAEGEWKTILLENGVFLGLLFILLRIIIVFWIGKQCVKSVHANNILPLLIFGACGLDILTGQFGRASTLGFAVFGGGLCLASCRNYQSGQKLR